MKKNAKPKNFRTIDERIIAPIAKGSRVTPNNIRHILADHAGRSSYADICFAIVRHSERLEYIREHGRTCDMKAGIMARYETEIEALKTAENILGKMIYGEGLA